MRASLSSAGAAVLLLLSACASAPPKLLELEPKRQSSLELVATPFFPQQDYQCGPAALATVLQAAGIPVLPDALVSQVYVPAKQGSLQVELLAAARRAGRIPYVIAPEPAALVAELNAGRPVLVMQNLGLGFLPVWHYAVVIGIEPKTDQVILRSGIERRELSRSHSFLRSWRLADYWGMVVLRPGEMPAQTTHDRYLAAVALAEHHLPAQDRIATYRVGLLRWPSSATAQFGLAHGLHAAGDLNAAEAAYQQLVTWHPRHAAGYNNLAQVLVDRGCFARARSAANRALDIAYTDYPSLAEPISETLRAIPVTGRSGESCR